MSLIKPFLNPFKNPFPIIFNKAPNPFQDPNKKSTHVFSPLPAKVL
jgi:hypothetical protein